VDPLEERDELVSNPVARKPEGLVRRILARPQAPALGIRLEL
jgi:hypothetical protein